MANKEIRRTISKLWLLNYCILVAIITLHLSYALGAETKDDIPPLNVTGIENNSTDQQPVAEPLTRYRRQPPRSIVKHIIRPKRYKMKIVKRPKIKYSFAEPPPAYYSRKPIIIKKPTFDSSLFEDFSHMNVESSDFDLPPSSYEAQSMDLDFYKHYEPSSIQAASYKEVQKPSVYTYTEPEINYKEPSYTEVSQSPSYTYSVPESSFNKINSKPSSATYSYTAEKPRKPHIQYGLPTDFAYSTGYDKPSDTKYTFEAPATGPVYNEVENSYYNKPSKGSARIPSTSYGIPEIHIPATGFNDYNKYSIVDQKPSSYASHESTKSKNYNFAEPPPQPEQSVEITYSPSYEINIPARQENSYSSYKNHHASASPLPEHENNYQEHPKYDESPQQYDKPGDSYENPLPENYEDISSSHQDVSGTNQPASYQPAPAKHQDSYEYIPTLQELPINVNHKHPPYDYPKSSYEVPIYDPIPFDASNQQEREIYPPQQTFDKTNRQQPPAPQPPPISNNLPEPRPANEEAIPPNAVTQTNVKRPQSPVNQLGRTRKRNRKRGGASTPVSTTKHILDVPELEEAFEKENRNKFSNSKEPEVHESQRFENINHQDNNINENYSKGPWNPMKIRTSPIMQQLKPSTNIPPITKKKRYQYNQRPTGISISITTTTPTTTETAPTNVEILSIEKSRSKTLYDGGIVPTTKIYNNNFFRNRFRLENANTSTTPQQIQNKSTTNENQFSKRTTKNTFDTTIFKSPINDRDAYRSLPKNHKLI